MIRKPPAARTLAPLILAATLALGAPAFAQDSTESWLPSLMTRTPEEGFTLAITMARKAVTTTQTDVEALHKLRPACSHDPASLIDVSGVAAAWFSTIAEANGYWRE